MTVLDVVTADAADVRLARRATGLLRAFNEAGVLSAADVHVAQRLGALAGEAEEVVLLGAALAVRAPRMAHVCSDLATIRHTATSELDEAGDLQALPWPDVRGGSRDLHQPAGRGRRRPPSRPAVAARGHTAVPGPLLAGGAAPRSDLLDRSQAPVPHVVTQRCWRLGSNDSFPAPCPTSNARPRQRS